MEERLGACDGALCSGFDATPVTSVTFRGRSAGLRPSGDRPGPFGRPRQARKSPGGPGLRRRVCTGSSGQLPRDENVAWKISSPGEATASTPEAKIVSARTGAATLRTGNVPVRVETQRDRLLAVKRGELPWNEVDAWRKDLHRDFEHALAETRLPERPDYEKANEFLIKARRQMVKCSLSINSQP